VASEYLGEITMSVQYMSLRNTQAMEINLLESITKLRRLADVYLLEKERKNNVVLPLVVHQELL
jgi:hypothetical protein